MPLPTTIPSSRIVEIPADAKACATRAPVIPPPTMATLVSCLPERRGYRRLTARAITKPHRLPEAQGSLCGLHRWRALTARGASENSSAAECSWIRRRSDHVRARRRPFAIVPIRLSMERSAIAIDAAVSARVSRRAPRVRLSASPSPIRTGRPASACRPRERRPRERRCRGGRRADRRPCHGADPLLAEPCLPVGLVELADLVAVP